MDYLGLIFLITAIIGLAFLLWTYTPRGRKWLKDEL